MIGIIDYGMGNIHSVKKALEFWGAKTKVIRDYKELKRIDKLVLPGVGAFGDALDNLKRLKLYEAILEYLNVGKIFLGICLGMHVLFEKSQESKNKKGFSIFKGEILRFNRRENLKVPHMGWNKLIFKNKDCPLLKGISNGAYVYFCHSFYPKVYDKEIVCATTHYGIEFASVIQKSSIFGLQFHPEKSQSTGLKIIKNFVRL